MKYSILPAPGNKKPLRVSKVFSAGLLSLFALAGTVYAADEMCPQVSNIMAQSISPERGFTYTANAIRGGWKGENPGATESYLDKVQFTSAAIRQTTDNGNPVYFVACDYEGEGKAGVRMSQRFPTPAKPVGGAWKDNFCSAGLSECAFKFD
ncbi:hypothetical protein PS914_00791 [Pseudomonas fluorescens]|uniref:DUF3757 domain-containing protein n=1 Tax=Pseudomonas fluorescens TaxID=294 RepID=UPI001241D704|nr:DUF3757 domain-containing protein [Pseudomonas fluorescens]VVP69368.1 hypothetical protein PS914_00791 [Pseudomonas fluorescens]